MISPPQGLDLRMGRELYDTETSGCTFVVGIPREDKASDNRMMVKIIYGN